VSSLSGSVQIRQVELERMFAAAAFLAPKQAIHAAGWLDPKIFRDERISKFWGILQNCGDEADAALDAGILKEITRWMNDVPSAMRVKTFAEKIVQENYLYQIASVLPSLAKAVGCGSMCETRRILAKMNQDQPLSREKLPDFGDCSLEFIASLDEDPDSIPASIDKLNQGLGGWWRGIASVICARPSMGKTAFGWQEARFAAESGRKVVVFSLEESRRILVERAACGELNISIRETRAGRLKEDEKQMLKDKASELMEVYRDNLVIDDRTDHTTDSIWQVVVAEQPDMVIVDHLRLLKDKDQWRSEVKRQGHISQRLKEIAKEFNCHMMVLAQLNRALEHRTDKSPTLSDLRDSGEIEENADLVLGLHRPDYYDKNDNPIISPTELNTLKFRNGPRVRFALSFDKVRQKFGPRQ